MVVTGLALTLVDIYAEDLTARSTIRELSRKTGKPYANVHTAATRLIARGILTKTTVGHSHSCGLNLASTDALLILGLAIERRRRARHHDPARYDHPEIICAYEDRDGTATIVTRATHPLVPGTRTIDPDEFLREEWKTAGMTLIAGVENYLALVRRRRA